MVADRWWQEFRDPVLNGWMEQALGRSFTLKSALHRLRAARALARREASDLLPDLNGRVLSDNTFQPGPNQHSVTWGLDASWQIDLWGEIESRTAAARLRAAATHEDYHAVALTLAAEIARTWFSLVEARAQLHLLAQQIETNQKGVRAQELRFGKGLARSPDVLRQRQLVESTREQMVVVRTRVEVLEHQLAVLMGTQPQFAEYQSGRQLPKLPPAPSTGVPSDLLARRPDVRRDYLALCAADQDLASAVSAQYPRLNLTGSVLNTAEHPETLFRNWMASIAGELIAPVLDGGQRRAEVARTSAVAWESFNTYGQTMLVALQEVEDGMARERLQQERIERLDLQLELAGEASKQLTKQYFIGDAAYLDVLSTIQAQQRLQRERLSAELNLVLIRIALYNALAGSFDTRPLPPSDQSPVDTGVSNPADFPPAPEPVEETESDV